MTFWKIFLNSLWIPRKKSIFKLNRIRMDIAVIYMFLLMALVSIPSLIEQIKANSTSTLHVHTFFYLIFFFMFYYLVIVIGVFILISIFAFIGTYIAKLANRRLHFAILWKIIAFSTTLPAVIYTITTLFFSIPNFVFLLFLTYISIMLLKIISIYPSIRR